jgi:(Z)-2-((N-methylformamido)methylene)-5-hydroxybutyrolactone dehydrogenase
MALREQDALGAAVPTYGYWIDGALQPASSRTIESVNPATGEVWAIASDATAADVATAVEAADRAFRDAAWSGLTPTARGELIRGLADRIAAAADELALIETSDNGKVLTTSRAEMTSAAQWLRFYAGAADKIQGDTIVLGPDLRGATIREPIGVVGAIAPFNAPIVLTAWKLAPALAAGNTIVIKPSPDTPISSLSLGRLAREAGFPDGVINVVTGSEEAGRALVADPRVGMISFTGSSAGARAIAAAAAGRLARVACEAGGKSPHIVFADADLEKAGAAAASGVFTHAGQTCVAGSRLLVQAPVFERFVERLAERADRIRVGDPLAATTQIGSLSSARQFERVSGYVEEARAAGADIRAGGRRPDGSGLDAGCFYRPTVITGVHHDARICQEEVFGPVVVALPFEDEDEALALANDVEYGLGAGVWTNDIRRAHRMSREIQAGTVWINTYRTTHWQTPFGGFKQSGFGRENGLEALHEFTELKTVVTDYSTTISDPFAD